MAPILLLGHRVRLVFDSVSPPSWTAALAVEAEGVTPQVSRWTGSMSGRAHPYRGYARIQDRPSSWDLTPNASDPTGTHIDFWHAPGSGPSRSSRSPGIWSRDSLDGSVNESIRPA